MRVDVTRINDRFQLQAKNEAGNTFILDNSPDGGGDGAGFRPMQSLLAAMAGCSSMDVIAILKKQKLEPFGLTVTVDGERETGKDANLWKTVHATFTFTGKVPKEKAERAVQLSLEKYCSVSMTLRAAGAAVTYDVVLR